MVKEKRTAGSGKRVKREMFADPLKSVLFDPRWSPGGQLEEREEEGKDEW